MLNKFLSILFIIVLAFNSFISTFILGNYIVNKSEIIELFCINKEETKFQCDGKCHLKSQIKKAEGEDDKKSPKWVDENPFTSIEINFKKIQFSPLFKSDLKYFELVFQLPLANPNILGPPPKLS